MSLTPAEAEELRRLEAELAEYEELERGRKAADAVRRRVETAPKPRPFSIYRATVGALKDAAQGVIDTGYDLVGSMIGGRADPVLPPALTALRAIPANYRQAVGNAFTAQKSQVQLPALEGEENAGTAERVVRGIGSFLVPYAGWARAVGVARGASWLGRAGRSMVAGGITDFSQYDPVSGNIANALRDGFGIDNRLLDSLASEEDDDILAQRTKAALASAPVGLAADALFEGAFRMVKSYRAWKGTAEEAEEAVASIREGLSLDPAVRNLPAPVKDPIADPFGARAAADDTAEAAFTEAPGRAFDPAADIKIDRDVTDFEDVLDFLKRKAGDPEIDEAMLGRFAENLLFGDPENALAKLGIDPAKLDFSKFDDPDMLGRFQRGLAEVYEVLAEKLGRSNIRVSERATIKAAQAMATTPDALKNLYGSTTNLAETLTAARLFVGAHSHKLLSLADEAADEIIAGGAGGKWAEFLEAFHRHAFYLGSLRGAGSEVGRALRSLKIVAKVDKKNAQERLAQAIENEDAARGALPGRPSVEEGASAYADRLVTDAEKLEALARLKYLGGDVGELSREVRRQNSSVLRRLDAALKETIGNLFSVSTAAYNVLAGGTMLGVNATSRALGAVGRMALSPLGGQHSFRARVALMDTWAYGEGIIGGFREAVSNTLTLLEREGMAEVALNLDGIGLRELAKDAAERSSRAVNELPDNFERADVVNYRNFSIGPAEQEALQKKIAELEGPRFYQAGLSALTRTLAGVVNGAGSLSRLGTILFINLPDQFIGTLGARAGAYSEAVRLSAAEAAELGLEGAELSQFLKSRTVQLMGDGSPGWAPDGVDAGRREVIAAHGDAEARAVLFQDDLELGINQFISAGLGRVPLMHMIVPFIKTPLRILERTAIDNTPLGLLKSRVRNAILAGGPAGDEALARLTLGTLAMVTAFQLADDRTIVGDDGGYGSSARLTRPSYSLRIGDDTYEFSRIDPLGTLLGLGADLRAYVDDMEGDPDAPGVVQAAAEAMLWGITANMLSKTWLTSLRNITELAGATSEEDFSTRLRLFMMALTGNRLVPASGIQRYVEFADDGIMREAADISDGFLRASIGADALPPKRDGLLGRPMTLSGPGRLLGIKGGPGADETEDPLLVELERLSFDLPRPRRSQMGVRLSAPQFSRWLELKGQIVRNEETGLTLEETLTELIQLPEYQNANRNMRVEMIRLEVEGFSRLATDSLIQEDDAFAFAALREEVFQAQSLQGGFTRGSAEAEACKLAAEIGIKTELCALRPGPVSDDE